MADTAKTNSPRLGDLVKWEVRREYCRLEVALDHIEIAAITAAEIFGYPVEDDGDGSATILKLATQAACNGLVLSEVGSFTLLNGVTFPGVTILRHGPAIINKDMIPINDYNAAAFTQATLLTALEAERILNVALASPVEIQVV